MVSFSRDWDWSLLPAVNRQEVGYILDPAEIQTREIDSESAMLTFTYRTALQHTFTT